jgi:hypothetical protein
MSTSSKSTKSRKGGAHSSNGSTATTAAAISSKVEKPAAAAVKATTTDGTNVAAERATLPSTTDTTDTGASWLWHLAQVLDDEDDMVEDDGRQAKTSGARQKPQRRRHGEALMVISIFALAIACYIPALWGEYVYDDKVTIIRNIDIRYVVVRR